MNHVAKAWLLAAGMSWVGCLVGSAAAAAEEALTFTTEGAEFAPVLVLDGAATVAWTFADGSTSTAARPHKAFGGNAQRTHSLRVTPWRALARINLGYDAGDGGTDAIEHVPDQHVSAVTGLALVAPTLRQWCSSYNQLTALDFSHFVSLDTIECYLSRTLTSVRLVDLPRLRRACFEDCDLRELDLSQCPALEDLRGAANAYPTIEFGRIGREVWHICVHSNPLTNAALFQDLSQFPKLSELFVWNDHQAGTLRVPATHPERGVGLAGDGNAYGVLDLRGALRNPKANGTVSFRGNRLSRVEIDGCVQLSELILADNRLASDQVDRLLTTLDTLGRSRATTPEWTKLQVDLNGNAVPGPAGRAAAGRLAAKGWTVVTADAAIQPPPPPDTGPTRIDVVTRGDETHLRADFDPGATAVWHWADGTTTPAASGATATRTGLGPGDHASWLMVSNGAALSRFGGADGGGQGHLVSIAGLEQAPALTVLYAYNESALTHLDRTHGTRTREYHLWGTALDAAAIDQVLADAVASKVRSGVIWCAPGTAASAAARQALIERGWTLNQ